MRRAAIVLAALLALAGSARAEDPLTGLVRSFFHYRAPPLPIAGDCTAIAAAIGAGATWRGQFSGRRLQVNDQYEAFASRGCFDSELACRVWQQQAINYAFGTIFHMSCRPLAANYRP